MNFANERQSFLRIVSNDQVLIEGPLFSTLYQSFNYKIFLKSKFKMTSVRPEWQSLMLEISDLIIGSITMIAAITFFCSFMKLKERTHGQYMILVLCVVDLIYPIMNILTTIFVRSEDSAAVFGCLGIYIFRFSLYFSTAISIFAYFILQQKQSFDPYRFRRYSVIICVILALFCPTM